MNRLKFSYIKLLAISLFVFLLDCDGMNDLHDKYLNGEQIYLGRVDSVSILAGKNQLEFTLWQNPDPKISETVVYWHQRQDSLIVPFSKNEIEKVFRIEDLEEKSYAFELVNRGQGGLRSLPMHLTSVVFGDKYIATLLNRGINSFSATPEKATIKWGKAGEGVVSTRISYDSREGKKKEIEVLPKDTQTEIADYAVGGECSITTTYQIKDAMEVFTSKPETLKFPETVLLDKALFADMDMPFDLTGQCWNGDISKLWDTKVENNNYYHGGCDGDNDGIPHHFTIDLGKEVELASFKMDPRQDCCQERNPKQFELWGILDIEGAATTLPPDDPGWVDNSLEKGWVKLIDCTGDKTTPASWKGSKKPLDVKVTNGGVKVRYIRFRFVESWDPKTDETALSEISVYAKKIFD